MTWKFLFFFLKSFENMKKKVPYTNYSMAITPWLQADIFSVLHMHLPATALLKVSMVSKLAKQLVDSVCHKKFSASRTFILGRCLKNFAFEYDASLRELTCTLPLHTESLAHFIFSSHIYPVSGVDVHLQHSLMVPDKYCETDVKNRTCHLVQFQQWRIESLKFYDDSYSIRLVATKYIANQKINLKMPVVLYVNNLANLLDISVREFSLMANLFVCRVCKQRHKSRQSYSAGKFEHRLLCLPCLKNFFVPLHSLQRTWKLRAAHVQVLHSNKMVHKFVNLSIVLSPSFCSWVDVTTNYRPVKMIEHWVNKEDMTAVLFGKSWNEFIHTGAYQQAQKVSYSSLFKRAFCEY